MSGKQLGEPRGKADDKSELEEVEKSSEEDPFKKNVEGNVQEAPERKMPSKTYTTHLPFP